MCVFWCPIQALGPCYIALTKHFGYFQLHTRLFMEVKLSVFLVYLVYQVQTELCSVITRAASLFMLPADFYDGTALFAL